MQNSTQLEKFHLSVESGRLAARELLGQVKTGLSVLELDLEEIGTIELVLTEVVNNICEHAYLDGEAQGPIDLTCRQAKDGLSIEVTDSGNPMPHGKTPLGIAANVEVDLMDLPEGGFGWFLIKDLAKDVVYRREGEENKLSLRMAIGARPHS